MTHKTLRTLIAGGSLICMTILMGFSKPEHEMIKLGQMAPDLVGTGPNGETIALSDFKGKVVLVDFWASWCKPCRHMHPELVETFSDLSEKYPEKFVILSVSLDVDLDKWKAAIKDDQLSWGNHICDAKGWKSPLAASYGVKSIPASFVINAKGKISEKDLHGNQLKTCIRKMIR